MARAWLAREDDGSSAVEFALVMTPLLMIIFGIMQYGFYFWAMQGGADAGRQAARLAAVGNPTSLLGLQGCRQGKSRQPVDIARHHNGDARLQQGSWEHR